MFDLRTKMRNLNGWRRLWLVVSFAFVVWGALVYPLELSEKGSIGRYNFKWAVEKELKNPKCEDYLKKDLMYLPIPEYSENGSTCWHIYTHRETSLEGKQMSAETYEANFASKERKMFLSFAGQGLALSLVASACLYLLGWTLNWIRVGFRNTAQKD